MKNINILPILISLGLTSKTIAFPQRINNEITSFGEDLAEIRKFHVDSKIQLRYAITDIETRMQNRHSEAKEVFFDMYIPKEAFVSNFTMIIKGKTYQANVKTKEVAKQIYENSTDTSGLLQTTSNPEFTDGKQVSYLIVVQKSHFCHCFDISDRKYRAIFSFRINVKTSLILILIDIM